MEGKDKPDVAVTPANSSGTSAPVQQNAPAPVQQKAPVPVQQQAPAPMQPKALVSDQSKAPVPDQSKAPAPVQIKAPAPAQSKAPAPAQSKAPVPAQSKAPAPAQSKAPDAKESKAPAPVESSSSKVSGSDKLPAEKSTDAVSSKVTNPTPSEAKATNETKVQSQSTVESKVPTTPKETKVSARAATVAKTPAEVMETDAAELKSPPTERKRKARAPPVEVDLRSPVKRARVPVQRFQSPIEELEHFSKPEKEEKPKKEDAVVLYKKNTFLAVRGAEGTFYLCRTTQNINSKTRKLRIQWLTLQTKPDTYIFDYADSTEMETVITEITMDKVSKTAYKLPKSEQTRVERILDRALRVEQGVSTAEEVEDEAMEEQLEGDEDSDQDVDSEDTDDFSPKKRTPSRKKSPKGGKRKSVTPKRKTKEKEAAKQKTKGSARGGKVKEPIEKKKGPDRNLRPNAKIKILEQDPFFESKENLPVISPEVTTKLVFRAINQGDKQALQEILDRTEGVCGFEDCFQSLSDQRDPLSLAGELGHLDLVDVLVDEFHNPKTAAQRKRKPPQQPIISGMSTGDYNCTSLGIRNIRALNVSRGNKEGNEALLKKETAMYYNQPQKHWMTVGVPVETMEKYLMSYAVATSSTKDMKLPEVIEEINTALKRGHRNLAGKYVAEAERLSGYGFNFLHKEVLNFTNEDLKDVILAASVRKKPFSNDAVTPLHCAAINPNPKYIRRLLSIEPDMNIQTRSRARPVHYAAVCESTATLEFLLERGASVSEADSSGDLPIHWAARAGRAKNIDVLVKHAKSEGKPDLVNDKWGLGNVNRPNRFSQCPLHLAVEEGHLETVRTLIRLGADVNKALSAGKDKMTPLMLAARQRHLNIARALVQSGATVESLDKMKRTALTHAVISGSSPVASYLLYLGADPNRLDSSNNSLVHYAAAYGWHFVLKLLVKDAGASPDIPNDWQCTPVNIAMLKGHIGIVEQLINHKDVDINFKTDSGMTLPCTVCGSRLVDGLAETLSALINNFKADPTILDINGYSALHHLAANNIKLAGTHWNKQVDPAAMAITVKMAEVLIGAGCDPTLATKEGKTPIMLAIEQANVSLVEFLVDRGGTVCGDKNKDEKTVLHLMAEQCCLTNLTPMLKLLAKSSAIVSDSKSEVCAPKVNGTVNGSDSAVQEEEKMEVDGDKETAKKIDKPPASDKPTDEKMEVSTTDKPTNGDAASSKDSNCVNGGSEVKESQVKGEEAKLSEEKSSEKKGVNQLDTLQRMAQERDFTGFTPLLRACQVYNTFEVQANQGGFSRFGQNIFNQRPNDQKGEAKSENGLSFIQGLIELIGSDVNATVGCKNMPDEPEPHFAPEGKSSVLHFMINPKCERKESVGAGLKVLLQYKPDTSHRDLKGKTPLMLAVESEKEGIVKSLLEAGADPNVAINIVGVAKVSPLILAAERASFKIMKMLIDHKADVNCCHSETLQTPVHVMVANRAREDDTIAMMQCLLNAGANINAANKAGDTPLHVAVDANKGHSDASTSIEEFMLNRGANVFAKNKAQLMPLHVALNKSGVDPIELCSLLTSFMREQRIDEPSERGFTPLLYAACSGSTICCMHLLQRKAALEAKEYRGNTAFNLTILNGHDSCATMLMQRGASSSHPIVVSLPSPVEKKETEEENKKKRPVMMWRPRRQWETAQPKENPGVTMSLFEMAVKNDLSGVAHLLLDTQGMTMEVIAAALNLSKFNLALRLLRRIPDVSRLHAKNSSGQNLFHILAMKTNRNSPDMQIKVAGALLEKGVSLSQRDNTGLTPLMYAALEHQSLELAKFLIVNDVAYNPRVKDNKQRDVMAAFMWNYDWVSDQFKVDEVRQWLELLTSQGKVSLDTLYDHALPDPLLLGARLDVAQPDYFCKIPANSPPANRTTPLIYTIRNYDFGLAKFLLKLGASPNFPDSRGQTPMMHAVQMNDVTMVKLLLNYDYDFNTGTVVAQAGLKPQLSKISSRQVMEINFMSRKEKHPDDLLDEEVKPVEDDAVSLSKHSEEDDDSVDLNEDVEAVDEVEALPVDEEDAEDKDEEDSDADTDIVEEEEAGAAAVQDDNVPEGATKLSLSRHVSQMVKQKQYSSIVKTSPCDLSLTDSSLWTAVHHAVCSLEHATFDNAEIVYILGTAGAPLDAKNDKEQTAMDLARKFDAGEIVRVLNRLLAMEPYNKTVQSYELSPSKFHVKEWLESSQTLPDFRGDAEQMLDKVDKAAGDTSPDKGPRPDANCEIRKSGVVASNPQTNIPYDVTLSKVDVSFGLWGMYNFYKLQIIQHTAKNVFVLFTRWGRIGSRGQFQHTPFQTLKDAAKEFCKIYRSKTGNDWSSTLFVNHPKKYRLMPKPEKKHKKHKVELNLETPLKSSLSEPVLDLITEISNVTMFEASVTKHGLDLDMMPFGRMNRETLLQARKILTELSEVVDKSAKLRNNLTTDKQQEYQELCEEISVLTNEYYHLVPMHGFEYDTITPISDKLKLREHTKLLGELLDMQVANTILLGANFRKTETHPMDYIYKCLSCKLQPLPEDHPEAQFVLTNVHASVPSAKINRLFRVSRGGEEERLNQLNLPNHQLLWHGSSMANFLSILSRGLLVTPPEVPWNGHLFGEGIYFADTFVKSANYCHNHSPKSNVKVMLLCQVALGNPKIDVKHGDEDHLDDDINSLKILGMNAPAEDFNAKLSFGASIPLGQVSPITYHPPARIQHNEYIVHSPSQVAIRYLMLYNG